ncbi:MAG: nuclear transport factor 2 family protein [Gemmatimonadota bacterium]|nr:nuclear transport factor 2 family protein [Gemmatimonadota bacterium]MDH3423767.1 nuclear transport factor 2 family protein [Gemmatimonadota bacterium]
MRRFFLLTAPLLLAACGGSGEAPDNRPGAAAIEASESESEYAPTPAQRAGAIAAVERLFEALATGDGQLLRQVMDPSVVMHFSETRDGASTFGSSTVDGLAGRITSSDLPLIERMWDPLVRVNGALATVWAPYDFYAGETFSHCGVDAVTLMETSDGWRIVGLSWTRLQPPACALHPEGPPV